MNKVEARVVKTNALGHDLSRAFTHKGSSKIMKSSSRFLISLTKKRNFIDMGPIKHIKCNFLEK